MEWLHNGRKITIGENGQFFFWGGGPSEWEKDDRQYATLALAREAIDNDDKLAAKERHATMSLPVMGADGELGVLTGINRNTGQPTGLHSRTYYIRGAAIKSLLAELKDIGVRQAQIALVLRTVTIRTQSHASHVRVSEYDRVVENLQEAYDKALDAAAAF